MRTIPRRASVYAGRVWRWRAAAGWLAALTLWGCGPSAGTLAIDVVTDLVPGREIDRVDVRIDGEVVASRDIVVGDDWATGMRVAELLDQPAGSYLVGVSLSVADTLVLVREVIVEVDGSQVATVVLSRACRDVSCEGGESCRGGRCESQSCYSENVDACGEPDCVTDEDCGPALTCAAAQCTNGVCLALAEDELCPGDDSVCLPEVGCASREHGTVPRATWLRSFANGVSHDVAVDAAGNAYVTGMVADPEANFGDGIRHVVPFEQVFVVSVDAAGDTRWSRVFGGPSGMSDADVAYGIGTDGTTVCLGGVVTGALSFGPGFDRTASDDGDGFVACLDAADGSVLWADLFSGAGRSQVNALSMEAGRLLVAGEYGGDEVVIGGQRLAGPGRRTDAFIAELDPATGAAVWTVRGGSGGFDAAEEIALESDGATVVAGYFTGGADFGGGPFPESGEDREAFVARYETDGAFRSFERVVDGDSRVDAIAVGAPGELAVGVSFLGPASVVDEPVEAVGSFDAALVSFDAAALRFVRPFGGPRSDHIDAITIDAMGRFYVTGEFERTVDFGGGPLWSGGAGCEMLIASFAPDGTHRWSRAVGLDAADIGRAVVLAPDGGLLVAGAHVGAIELDDLMGTETSRGRCFLARFEPD